MTGDVTGQGLQDAERQGLPPQVHPTDLRYLCHGHLKADSIIPPTPLFFTRAIHQRQAWSLTVNASALVYPASGLRCQQTHRFSMLGLRLGVTADNCPGSVRGRLLDGW